MRVPNTPSTPSSSKSPAMDNRSFSERKTEMGRNPILARLPKRTPEETLRFFGYPSPTVQAICRIRSWEALDLDDIEEVALVINDPRAPIDGFLFTPTLLHVLGDNPRAVWYGRHTLFLVGEAESYSLLHWDRNLPHYIAHYDPQGLDGFTCPPAVQRLVKATFHQQACPDLPIMPAECPKSDRIGSGFYSLYFAQALLMSKPIPPIPNRLLPEPFVQMIRNFHLNPAPPTSNVVQMRPIRRTPTGSLEWSMPDAKVSSTSSTELRPWEEPCIAPSPQEQFVDSGVGAMASPSPMPRGDPSSVSSSGRIVPPASLCGHELPFPHGSLPFRSVPTNSGAVPGTSPANGPSAKGKEPATSFAKDSSTKDDESESGATDPPSAKGKERQGPWHERLCELVDTLTRLEAHEKLLSQLAGMNDQMLMEEAFNKFAAAESNTLIANGKQPEYLSFKEFMLVGMLAGVDKRFKANEVKSELLKLVKEKSQEEAQAAANNGQSADENWRQSPRFKEMLSIYEERRRVCMMEAKSKYTKILRHYYESQAGVDNGPSVKGKEPAASSTDLSSTNDRHSEASITNGPLSKGKEPANSLTNGSSVQQKESEASVTIGPSAKGKERQVRLYEEVKAEIQDKNLALRKANYELRVMSAAVLIARCRLGRKDFSVSEFKKGMDACNFTKDELSKACDQISIFISPALRERIINGNLRFEHSDMKDFTRDSHDDLLSPARFTETKRLEEELGVKKEAQQEAANGYTKARMKKQFLDDAWSDALWQPMSETLMKNLEDLFGSRDFLSFLKNHDSHGRAGDNDK